MFAGSDDAVKVWLNGELVHNNPINRPSHDFQDQFPVTFKKGTNILLVAVYEKWGAWTGFFGFAADAEYTLILPTGTVARPAWDVNEDGITDATDASTRNGGTRTKSSRKIRVWMSTAMVLWMVKTLPLSLNTSAKAMRLLLPHISLGMSGIGVPSYRSGSCLSASRSKALNTPSTSCAQRMMGRWLSNVGSIILNNFWHSSCQSTRLYFTTIRIPSIRKRGYRISWQSLQR